MGKFKVGDTVRCVSNGKASRPNALGYKPDKEFIVDSIHKASDDDIYFPKNGHGVYESDLILVKTLPKSFACQNTNQVLWDKYITWLNSLENNSLEGDVTDNYYGINKRRKVDLSCLKDKFDTIISLEEWNEIVNGTQIKTEKVMTNKNYYSITREQLKSIHDVACGGWKEKITEYAGRNPFGDTITFTQAEVDIMVKAATTNQLPVLERVFGKQTREIDLSTGCVDGKSLFHFGGSLTNTLMCVRSSGNYGNRAFILDETYNWELEHDTVGNLCLVPTRK